MDMIIKLLWIALWAFTLWSTLYSTLSNIQLFRKRSGSTVSSKLVEASFVFDLMMVSGWAIIIVCWRG